MKKIMYFLTILILFVFAIRVDASNISLDDLASDIKKSYTDGLDSEIDVTYDEDEFIIKYVDAENREFKTSFTIDDSVLTYNKKNNMSTDEVLNDSKRIAELLYSVALLNGYDKSTIERYNLDELKKFNFKDYGIEVSTYNYKEKTSDGEITVQAYSRVKLDINRFRFELHDDADGIENPRTGSSQQLFISILIILISIFGIMKLNNFSVFKNL